MGLLKPTPKRLERLPGLTVPYRPRRALWRPSAPYIIRPRELLRETMLAPSFGAVSTIAGSSGGSASSVALNYPSGITAGQYLVAGLYGVDSAAGSVDIQPASGWTQIVQLGQGGLAQIICCGKVATGSESGTVTFSSLMDGLGATARFSGQIARYSNVDTSGTPYESTGSNNGSDASAEPASITSTAASRLAVFFLGVAGNRTVAAISGATGGTWSESSAEEHYGVTTIQTLNWQQADLPSAGTLSGGNAAMNGSSSWRNLTFALIGTQDAASPRIFNVGQAVNRASRY